MDLRRSLVEKKLSSRSTNASKSASKNGSRAASNHGTDDEYDTDDNMSVLSIDSNESFNEMNQEQNWEESFNECVEAILERKGSSVQSREESLSKLIKFMTVRMTKREIGERDIELATAVGKMLKGSRSEREALLCTRTLAILYVTCPDNDSLYDVISSSLRNHLTTASYALSKAAAIQSLATAVLVYQAASASQGLCDLMVEIVENDGNTIDAQDDPNVVSASIDSLAIAITVLAGGDVLEDIQASAPCLIDQLESVDPHVRAAAGEALALFFELTAVDPSDEEAVEAYSRNPPVDDVHRLIQMLEALATTSSKRQSKASRREQHHRFREILATVSTPNSHSAPTEVVKFGKGNQVLYATTWLQVARLSHLRRVLGTGLQVHLKKNAAVRRVLAYDGPQPQNSDEESDPDEDLSKDLKHSINQEIRKQRHKDRNSERKEKSAMSSSFLADEDDI